MFDTNDDDKRMLSHRRVGALHSHPHGARAYCTCRLRRVLDDNRVCVYQEYIMHMNMKSTTISSRFHDSAVASRVFRESLTDVQKEAFYQR